MTHKLAKNTFYLTLASVGQKIIAFVYFLFLARIMMPENTGSYFLATSLVMMFSVVADFGITSVLIREIAKNPEQAQTFTQKTLSLKIPFIILAFVGLIGMSFVLGYDAPLRSLIALASIILILDSVQVFFYGMLRGRQELRYESFGMFFGMFTTAVLGGLVLLFSPSLVLLILALAFGSFTNIFISGYGVIKTFGLEILRPRFEWRFTKILLKTALPFALAAIFVKVYSYVDSIMISKFLGTLEVGLYSIAYKFTYAFQFLPLAFVAALYPSFSSSINEDAKMLRILFERSMWYMMLIATPITLGIWLIASEAVSLAGNEYIFAGPVLQTLVLVLIPIFLDFPIGSLLNAANRQVTKTIIIGITMICNVVLNFVLIPRVGVIGAAYAALVSFTFMFVVGLLIVPSIVKDFSFKRLAWMFTKIGSSGIVMLFIGIIIKSSIGWILTIPVCAVVYILMLFVTRSIRLNDLVSIQRLVLKKQDI